jgi:hypothetical protein
MTGLDVPGLVDRLVATSSLDLVVDAASDGGRVIGGGLALGPLVGRRVTVLFGLVVGTGRLGDLFLACGARARQVRRGSPTENQTDELG